MVSMQKPNILVSACLMGIPCRYDGKSVPFEPIKELLSRANVIPFCAEVYGGLPTPRASAELQPSTGRVALKDGTDVSDAFARGAREAARIARLLNCRYALLKDKSPSCGVGEVYDGTFTRTLVPGDGRTARALIEAGVRVFSCANLGALLEALDSDE